MARDDPQFNLRMTQELKEKITERAKLNGRSLNAEIVQILEDAISSDERRAQGLDLTGASNEQMDYILDIMTKKLVDKVGEALADGKKKPT